MDRRSFIKNTGLASATVFTPGFAKAFSLAPKGKVIIIGAGFAGLSAAYKLKNKGIDFLVLESRKRVGGRIFSHKMSNDLVIELGGEWVGNSHTRMRELCDELNLSLQNNQFNTHLIYKGQYNAPGKWDYSDDWQIKFKKIIENYG